MEDIKYIILSQDLTDTITKYGTDHAPEECCGMLTGSIIDKEGIKFSYPKTWYPITNRSPEDFKWDYVMDPNEYMKVLQKTNIMNKKSNIHLTALFHTHPNNKPIPSQFDIKGASWNTIYLIYSVIYDELMAWYWNGEFFKRIPINGEKLNYTHLVENKNIEGDWEPWKNVKSQ